jgi:hypothetical protein
MYDTQTDRSYRTPVIASRPEGTARLSRWEQSHSSDCHCPATTGQSSSFLIEKHSIFSLNPKYWIPAFAGMTAPFKHARNFGQSSLTPKQK